MRGGFRLISSGWIVVTVLSPFVGSARAAAPSGAASAAASALSLPSGIRLRPMQDTEEPSLRPMEDLSAPAPAGGPVIGAVIPSGGEELSRAQVLAAVAPFVGQAARQETLKALVVAVTRLARNQGFIFAHCTIPAQRLEAGVLSLTIDLGRIDEIRFKGPVNGSVEGLFSRLVGKPVRQDDLDRVLALAGDIPGITLGRPDYRRQDGRGVLTVPIGYTPMSAGVAADNRGLTGEGPARVQAALAVRGLFSDRDEASGQIMITPGHGQELVSVSARYTAQINPNGTQVSATYGYLHANPAYVASAPLANVDIHSAQVNLSQALWRRTAESAWIDMAFNYASSRQTLYGWQEIDRIPTVYGDVNGFAPLLGGRLRAGVSAAYEPRMLDVTPVLLQGPYGLVYDGYGFVVVDGWANWTGALTGPLSASLDLSAQSADRPLPFLQKISIGGPTFGRAYELGERTGDRGVLGSAELRGLLLKRDGGWLRRFELYLYADGGKVANLYGAAGGGELYSYGAGLRAALAHSLQAGLEIAQPLTQLPDARSPRINATVEADF